MSEYRYYVDSIEVFPLNDSDVKYKFSKVSASSVIYDKTMDTELVFKQQSGSFNFKTQESSNKCKELSFRVDKLCSGEYTTYYEGIFSVTEGKFNESRCTFSVKPRKKAFMLGDVEFNILQTPYSVKGLSITGIEVIDFGYRNYTQAKYFDKAILYLAQKSNPNITGIISNFFQINPTGPFYVPGATNNYQYMAFSPLADIQEPIPSNLTTKCMVKFFDVMDDLNVLFDVFWYIDSNNNLRIEHRIYFNGISGLNLVGSKFLNGKTNYTYDLADMPKEEIWSINGHSQSAKIVYNGLSNIGKNENSKTYATRVISTDYTARFYGGASEKGLFLFATNGGLTTFGEWRMLIDTNGWQYLNPEFLVKELHTYYRPNIYGILHAYLTDFSKPYVYTANSGGIVLSTDRPIKKQEEISVPICCSDDFNPSDIVQTDMGDGYVEEAVFNTKGSLLKMTLKYTAENCNNFLPSDISGLQLWLKNNDVVVSGGLVSQWNDSSGNSRHAVQAVGANKPTMSGTAVRFYGAQFLTTPAFQMMPSKRGTVIALFQLVGQVSASGGSGFCILSTNDGSVGTYFDISSNIYYQFISYNEGVTYPQNLNYFPNLFGQSGLFILNRFEDTYVKTRNNSLEPINNPGTNSNTQPLSKPLIIGDNPNAIMGNAADFKLLELMIYDHSLNDTELDLIEYYLVKKGIYTTTKY